MSTAPEWTRHYQPGVAPEISVPTESLGEMFSRSCDVDPDAVALDFFGATTTYGQLKSSVERVAEALRRLGVKAGDRVAIVLPNCPHHVVAFYAVLRLGAIVVEHNPLYTAPELAALFADHGAKVAICWDSAVGKLPTGVVPIAVNLLDEFPIVKRLALSYVPVPKLRALRAKLHTATPGVLGWKSLLDKGKLSPDHPQPGVDDLAVIQYTSGTTGKAKGAMLTHFNLYCNALQGAAWMRDAVDGKETSYALIPMFHAFGMTLYLTFGVLKRSRIVLFPSFDVDMVLDAARRVPPTIYCAVPPIYDRTAARAKERGISLASAKFCISGAMALTDEIVSRWEAQSGGLLVEGYGLTETAPVALGNPFWPTRRTGTIGVPFPSTLRKVVDPADPTREVAPGEEGELLLKGPQVFRGYWNDDEATRAAFTDDGWLHTGDLVTLDDDGFATVVDRLKEIIITGGFNVSPTEVEAALREHPAIAEVAVVGVPSDHSGETVVAAVVPTEGATIDTDEARAWAKQRLAAYKVPRHFVTVDELPKSMLGKVLRRQVRDQIASRVIDA